jgi:hypothetical protein
MHWHQVCSIKIMSQDALRGILNIEYSAFLFRTGVDPRKIMAELCMKDGGTCRGAGGSMHIYVSCCFVE